MKASNERGKLILVIGGARSGKSAFAEELVRRSQGRAVYIATAQTLDAEMANRIALHQARRPSNWVTIEETHQVSKCLAGVTAGMILVDCLTLLVSNLLLDDSFPRADTKADSPEKTQAVMQEVETLAKTAASSSADVIIVTNEVGQGLVPVHALGRTFRDLAGQANQMIASYADEVYLVVAGLPIELKVLAQKTWAKLGEEE